MQAILLLALFAPLVLCYDAKYDSFDVDKIIADEAMFNSYIACTLDKGPCSLEYSEDLRKLLPEIIATSCEKCSDKQKSHIRKSVKALQEKKPAEFKEFRDKYDPKGEYEEKFVAFVMGTAK